VSTLPSTRPPWCPQCHAPLDEVIRYRRLDVEAEGGGRQDEKLSVEMVFCSRCRSTLGIFRADE
jgi:hypothetical protein